jgi:thioredoxin-related protein
MAVHWRNEINPALAEARKKERPVLLDFSAAPESSGCSRLEVDVYANDKVTSFINDNFVPVKVHIREQPEAFDRFGVLWTPTVVALDYAARERRRFTGYLPPGEFLAELELALADDAFARNRYAEAGSRYREVARRFPQSELAPEALYWAAVARYKETNDATALVDAAREFRQMYPASIWAQKAAVWD